jgi:hypothetical protein
MRLPDNPTLNDLIRAIAPTSISRPKPVPVIDPALIRAEYKKEIEDKNKRSNNKIINKAVEEIYYNTRSVITKTDKKSYCYPFPTFSKYTGLYGQYDTTESLLQLSGPIIPEVIDALKKLFPTMRVELKVYTCSGGKSGLNCKCGGHQNCISIDWSAT